MTADWRGCKLATLAKHRRARNSGMQRQSAEPTACTKRWLPGAKTAYFAD
jgi:hypothetical protein